MARDGQDAGNEHPGMPASAQADMQRIIGEKTISQWNIA
jgi:hypothetical protein